MRLGMYADNVYRREGDRIATVPEVHAFMLFVAELRHRFDLVLFGREAPAGAGAEDLLPPGLGLVPLPWYRSLHDPRSVLGALVSTVRATWRGLDRVDGIWVFGPNPMAAVVVLVALARRKPVVLAVRQDTLRYFRSRGAGGGAMLVVRALDGLYRLLGRRLPVTAVGDVLAAQYRGRVLAFAVTLVRERDVAAGPARDDYDGPIRLLAVGRVDREKDPLGVVEALALLGSRYSLTWVGSGPLESEVRAWAAELGVRVDLRGFVPFGDELRALYRDAHVFVHGSLSEGVPGALVEALAFGVPVAATAVGGVPAVLDAGRAGLLVPPSDPEALAAAVRRLVEDGALRASLVAAGLEGARTRTLEAETARVADFVAAGLARTGAGYP